MGQVILNRDWWWDKLKDQFFPSSNHYIKGNISLCYGKHEVEIDVGLGRRFEIKQVYTSIESDGCPVCVGDVSMIGVVIKEIHKFVLYADIKTNTANINWLVEYGRI